MFILFFYFYFMLVYTCIDVLYCRLCSNFNSNCANLNGFNHHNSISISRCVVYMLQKLHLFCEKFCFVRKKTNIQGIKIVNPYRSIIHYLDFSYEHPPPQNKTYKSAIICFQYVNKIVTESTIERVRVLIKIQTNFSKQFSVYRWSQSKPIQSQHHPYLHPVKYPTPSIIPPNQSITPPYLNPASNKTHTPIFITATTSNKPQPIKNLPNPVHIPHQNPTHA